MDSSMKQPTALFLADILEDAGKPADIAEKCATELRRLHAENEALRRERDDALSVAGVTHGVFPELYRLRAQRDALLEALKEIAADYADRFNLDCPSTNPGIKLTIKQARAAIKAAEENT